MILAKDCCRPESSDYAGSHTPAQLHPAFASQLLTHRAGMHKSAESHPASAPKTPPTELLNDRISVVLRVLCVGAPIFRSETQAKLYSAVPSYRETEIKLRVGDLVALIRKLNRLGARTNGRVLERNTLFDTPDGDFRRRGRLLRLRVETPARSPILAAGPAGAILTSKQPAPVPAAAGYKQNLESEIAVTAPKRWFGQMRALGLRPAFRYEKFRTSFRLGRLHLDVDETPVGTFLELEGDPRRIDRAAQALGYSRRDYIRATYWDLYAAHCRRHGKIPRDMLFGA